MTTYNTSQLAEIFNKNIDTIRRWAAEFARHLSPTGQPEKNKQLRFTEEDVAVLTWVAARKLEGAVYADIHTELDNGQRGELPSFVAMLTGIELPDNMLMEIESLQTQLQESEMQRRELHDRVIALETEVRLLREQLANSGDTAELHQLIGRLRYEIEQLKGEKD